MSPHASPRAARSSLAQAAPVFAALGDPTRLRLVSRLCEGPASITALTSGAGITRQAVTKHLVVLSQAGLVHDARRGRERFWTLAPARLEVARRGLEAISRQWDERLRRLQELVETD